VLSSRPRGSAVPMDDVPTSTVREDSSWIKQCWRLWTLPPFEKQWEQRQAETRLIDQLAECLDHLLRDPTQASTCIRFVLESTLSSACELPRVTASWWGIAFGAVIGFVTGRLAEKASS
jgi:hypothetical protein